MSFARVIVDLPVAQPLDYRVAGEDAPRAGELRAVQVGRRRLVGIVVEVTNHSNVEESKLRELGPRIGELSLSGAWLSVCRFTADYYHFGWGEVALPALPPGLRKILKRPRAANADVGAGAATPVMDVPAPDMAPPLRAEQQAALDAVCASEGYVPYLLFGVTGSGKTEVYLRAIEHVLARDDAAQALLLVPEINLTPQLAARLAARFPGRSVVRLHSAMTPGERARAWTRAHEGRAQIVLGTRSAVFASFARLRLIVVDEEHDTSYKAHGGVPFSARDLAIKRAQLEGVPVVLGSATPSLESWHHMRSGRYRELALVELAGGGANATRIETVDLARETPEHGLAAALRIAIDASLARGEQALVFINRRGFAPVLRCSACEWLSKCPRCETFAAYHKVGASLRCHHCGWSRRVPSACPDCGNQDLVGVGQGTQRIEESLRRIWPDARIARIDRDSAQGVRGADRAGATFDAVHAGEIDVLVGTQMITKGHDFRRVTTVGVLNADAQLIAADFRAPERLFALLMQVAGRAGRAGLASRVLIQTRFPRHPLFAALAQRSYADFAQGQIAERQAARLPPFVHHALLTCSARTLERAIGFLNRCVELAEPLPGRERVSLYDAVPMPQARLANESRGQLLVEASQRSALHAFLDEWLPQIRAMSGTGVLHWGIEVDPQAI